MIFVFIVYIHGLTYCFEEIFYDIRYGPAVILLVWISVGV